MPARALPGWRAGGALNALKRIIVRCGTPADFNAVEAALKRARQRERREHGKRRASARQGPPTARAT